VAVQFPAILAQAALSAVPPARAAATAMDMAQAAHFLTQVQSGAGTVQAAQAATAAQPATPAAEAAAAAGHSGSLGDAILRGLESVRNGLQQDWASTTALIDPQAGPVSTQRMLQFQVGVLGVGFEQQMIAGLAAKTVQNVDQLVKMQ
jgi:hypothetical protein